jgi:hypothetical protein
VIGAVLVFAAGIVGVVAVGIVGVVAVEWIARKLGC